LKIIQGPEITPIENILYDIDRALKAKLYHLAIIIAFTLPDVCAALEQPNGKSDAGLYRKWYKKHARNVIGLSPGDCYDLRSGMVHQGRMRIDNKDVCRVIFTVNESSHRFDGFVMGDAYVFDAEAWCGRWIAAVRAWYLASKNNVIVQKNLQHMLQLQPNGLAPYIVGTPIIA
jgi:hypothetical protein